MKIDNIPTVTLLSEIEKRLEAGFVSSEERFVLSRISALPNQFYGDGGTFHSTGKIDIQMNKTGRVTQVWYRCLNLPFNYCTDFMQENECNPDYGIHGIVIDRGN